MRPGIILAAFLLLDSSFLLPNTEVMQWSVYVDIAAIVAMLLGGYFGYRRGVVAASANLIGLVLSLVIAYFTYPFVSTLVLDIWNLPAGIAHILAFLLIAFLVDSLVTWLIFWASLHWLPWSTSRVSRILGIAPGILNNVVMVAYLGSLFTALPIDHPVKTAVMQSKIVYPLTQVVAKFGSPADKLVAPALSDLSRLFTIEPDSKELVHLPFTSQNPQLRQDIEEQMLSKVNQERTSRGIGALTMDNSLRQVARLHSLDMFRRGYFSHYTPEGKDPFDRMAAAGITYQTAGENLALAPTLDMAHTGLMNSPGHRKNILDPNYHKIGIGIYQDPRYGMMFSQEFTD